MSEIYLSNLHYKLALYKRKFYLNLVLKGALLSLGLLASVFIVYNLVEHFGNLNKTFRFLLFSSFVILACVSFFILIVAPFLRLFNFRSQLSDEDAAQQIGKFFPEVNDKLLNIIQLEKFKQESGLVAASISQKAAAINTVPLASAIDLTVNKRYAKYIFIPLLFIISIAVIAPNLFIDSTTRIIHFDQHFAPPAPFDFIINNKQLEAFKNEDFKVSIKLQGTAIPADAYISLNGKKTKMQKDGTNEFSYWIRDLQKSENFSFDAAGFNSDQYELKLKLRPSFIHAAARLSFPNYLKRKSETIQNIGNLTVPEGTMINWSFATESADRLHFNYNGKHESFIISDDKLSLSKQVFKSTQYGIRLEREKSNDVENLLYTLEVIPDEYPKITLNEYRDSATFSFLSLAGTVTDDYGLNRLKLFYSINDGVKNLNFKSIAIPISSGSVTSNYLYNWVIDSLELKEGNSLKYFLQVWDNDGVHGSKSTKSSLQEFKLPSREEIVAQMDVAAGQTKTSVQNLITESGELKKKLDHIEEKLKGKNNLDWQDKKALEDIAKQDQALKDKIEQLAKENKALLEKTNKLTTQDPEVAYKMNQLQKLMDQLLDEETKNLFKELQKALDEQASKNEIDKLINELQKKDDILNNDLDRALELFKQMQFDQKLNNSIEQLKELSKDQKELSEQTTNAPKENTDLLKQQEELQKEFKDVEKQLEELSELNKELEQKQNLGDTEQEKQAVEQSQKQSGEQLSKGQNKKAAQSQKEAAEKMDKMASKLAEMQAGEEMQEIEENLNDLRAILENLIRLSFDQEALMKDFKKISQTDPQFIALSQKQLKLQDDSKMVEDSLLSLSKRVFQIESFVTREVAQMKDYMTESTEYLKNRRPEIATGKQQFAMTSINNLALLLNDVLKQMQEQMANAMKSGGKMCNKPGKKLGSSPGLGELQKQLNEKIQELGKGGQSGKAMSESLAKLAAQQEMIRKALKELDKSQNPGGKTGGNALKDLSKEMEQTEIDLVNKKLTQQTIVRQKEILTRLLEAEKSAKERELDNKRESNSAKDISQQIPSSLQNYLKLKEKEIELLKSISPRFTPYYKQQVTDYFQKIEN